MRATLPRPVTEPISRSILLVSHFYPPARIVAANRPEALARHLRRMGHRVAVLTSSAYGELAADAEEGTVRSFDLQLLQARLRGERTAGALMDSSTASDRPHPLSRLAVPDAQLVAWTGFARRRALRMARSLPPDCVITTSPPESVHLVGSALRRRGIPWVADMRDGWVYETMKEGIWPWRSQHRLSERMERHLLRQADAVTAVQPAVIEDLQDRLGIEATVVPNGWDPEAHLDSGSAEGLLDPDRASIVFTGHLGGAWRDPRPLIEALAALAREDPDTAARLELAFAGSFTEDEVRLFERDVAPAKITVLGALPRSTALALQRAADVALIITGPRRQEVPAKLGEYIGAWVPILVVARPETTSFQIVRDADAGISVDPRNPEDLLAALRRIAAGEIPRISEEERDRWRWSHSAELMAATVEDAIANIPRGVMNSRR
jgi:glycosyltransferase involved in cell wall biosynthesis